MRFVGHIISGLIVATIVIAIFGITSESLLAGAAIVIGSVFPDIDHPFSYVRRAFAFVLFLVIVIFAYPIVNENKNVITTYCEECNSPIVLSLLTLVIAGVLVLLVNFFIPFHRGPLHGILAVIAFGLGLSFIAALLKFNPALVGISGAGGYLLHLVCDIGEK